MTFSDFQSLMNKFDAMLEDSVHILHELRALVRDRADIERVDSFCYFTVGRVGERR